VNARDKILGRIRDAQAGQIAGAPAAETISIHLGRHPRGPLPPPADDLLACFKERALKLSSDVLETDDRMKIPALLAGYLGERKLPKQGVCWPSLAGLPWSTAGLEIDSRPAKDHDMVGITGAFCAIAETGTLMLLSGAETPATTSLLTETHVAVIDPRRIVASLRARSISFPALHAPPISNRPSRWARTAPTVSCLFLRQLDEWIRLKRIAKQYSKTF
jgi:L-lactate dehydrogenase complex protein LldG